MSNSSATEIRVISDAAARWVAKRDTGLSPGEQADFERWLAEDSRHWAALEHYAKTWALLDRPGKRGTADAVVREMSGRLKRRSIHRIQMSAICACLVAGFALFWSQSQHVTAIAVAPAKPVNVVVLQPERRVLRDGSIVELKPGADILVQYDDSFRRVVLLQGEAHFQVAKGQPRPFVAEAGGIEARAVGTAFAVKLGGERVEVLVTEGSVAVENASIGAASAEQNGQTLPAVPLALLGGGDRIVVSVADHVIASPVEAVSESEITERLAWRTPRLEFSNTPLADAIARVNQSPEFGAGKVLIVIDPGSADLGMEPVTGIFRTDKPEAFARVLELSLGITAHRIGDQIVLRKSR